ncbi:MAG: 2-amino-4-hydroxy-6-hydroxymethyldihydropteridine diphosphokinase [Desulfomonilia bacterium]
MSRAFLSLGSNVGEKMVHLRTALEHLSRNGVMILRLSSVYETRAVEVKHPQENYLNMVIKVHVEKDPYALLDTCQMVEDALERERPYSNAPRTMDIDILMIDGISLQNGRLTIPHPRMEQRSFVIDPLSEIEPLLILPSGRPITEVKNTLSNDDIVGIWKFHHG